MNDDLLKMLGLSDKPKETREEPLRKFDSQLAQTVEQKQGEITHQVPSSKTALKLDEFDLQRGAEIAKEAGEQDATAMADFFGLCYRQNPQTVDKCVSPLRLKFVKTVMESPDYKALHVDTTHNALASKIGACKFAREYAKVSREELRKKALDKGRPKTPRQQQKEEAEQEANLIGAVGNAVAETQTEVDELNEIDNALQLGGRKAGVGQGSHGKLDTSKLVTVYGRVKNSYRLKKIFELAGRYRRAMQGRQREKLIHGYDDMVGITVDDDPSKLLTTELAKLDDPDLELDTLYRISNKQAMARQHIGYERVGKGPVVVVVDESSSMGSNEAIFHAKAFAAAMAWLAIHQRRWCVLVGFSGGSHGTMCVLKPGKPNEEEFIGWLEHFWDGGTTHHVPFEKVPFQEWPELVKQGMPPKKTDLVLISDGEILIPSDVEVKFNQWKRDNSVRAIGLLVGYESQGMSRVLDETFSSKSLTPDDKGVLQAFSI